MKIKQLESNALKAVMMLRTKKLSTGHPFMIFMPSLPANHCLLEFPNGEIKEVTVDKTNSDYKVIRMLSANETLQLRKKYKLH